MYSKQIKEKRLDWGGRIFATRFASNKSISIVGSVRLGSRLAENEQLAQIHAAMLLEGTKKYSKKDIQALLDTIGATLSFSTSSERLIFTARVLSEHAQKLLELISHILRESTFPNAELEILKKRDLSSLSLEAQDTRTQAQIALQRLLFGPDHPNWTNTTEESREYVDKVTQKKLLDFHKKIQGSSLVVSAAGDISASEVFTLADFHFKKLPQQEIVYPGYVPSYPVQNSKKTVSIEHKENIDYFIGIQTGITNDHKDYPALLLGIHILGNPGFTGRLMQEIREERGLTYAVYSFLQGFTNTTDGYATVWATFAPQLFSKGRHLILQEIKKIVAKGVTTKEVRQHRDQYIGSYKVRLSTSAAFAQAAHDIGAQGRSLSYLDEFPKKIASVTPAQVNKALEKYFITSKLSETAAGPVHEDSFK